MNSFSVKRNCSIQIYTKYIIKYLLRIKWKIRANKKSIQSFLPGFYIKYCLYTGHIYGTSIAEKAWKGISVNSKLIFSKLIQALQLESIRTQMPSQSKLNSAEEITYLHPVAFNPFLIVRSALDLLHLTRYFQRNSVQILNKISLY